MGGGVGALSDWASEQSARGVHVWFRGVEGTSDFSIDDPPGQNRDALFSDTLFWYETARGNTALGARLFRAADTMPWKQNHHAIYLKEGRRYLIAYRMHPGARGRHADFRFHDLDSWLRISDTMIGPWRDALVWLWGALAKHHIVEAGEGVSLFYAGYPWPEIASTWMRLYCDAKAGDRLFVCVDDLASVSKLSESTQVNTATSISEQARLFNAIEQGVANFVKTRYDLGPTLSWGELIRDHASRRKNAPVLMKSDEASVSLDERLVDMALAAMGLSDRKMWQAFWRCGAHAALLQRLGVRHEAGLDHSGLLTVLYCNHTFL